jgi:hypothetical protein
VREYEQHPAPPPAPSSSSASHQAVTSPLLADDRVEIDVLSLKKYTHAATDRWAAMVRRKSVNPELIRAPSHRNQLSWICVAARSEKGLTNIDAHRVKAEVINALSHPSLQGETHWGRDGDFGEDG